jgi:hypothetical protein
MSQTSRAGWWGLVGGVRSRAAKAGDVPNNDTSTTRIAARQKRTFLIMLYLQSPHKKFYNRRAAANERYVVDALPDWLD